MALITCHECGSEFSNTVKRCPQCGAKRKPGKKAWIIGGVIAGWFSITMAITAIHQNPTGVTQQRQPEPSTYEITKNIDLDFSWKKGGFDNVFLPDFHITNHNAFAVQDITISCTLKGASGTEIGTLNKTIYDIFDTGKRRDHRSFSMGFINSQAATANCYPATARKHATAE